jgi:hypothetical protein
MATVLLTPVSSYQIDLDQSDETVGLGGDEVDAGSEVAWFRVSILHLFDAPKERKA